MKRFLIFLPLFFLSLGMSDFYAPQSTYSILELEKNGMAKFNFQGINTNNFSDDELLSASNLQMLITNTSAEDISVIIPAGLRLKADMDEFQDMVLPQTLQFVLRKGEKRAIPLIGKCVEASDMGPGESTAYVIEGMTSGSMLKLAQYADKNKLGGNSEIQYAFWAISDQHSLANLQGNSPLQKYVSEITKRPIPPPGSFEPAPPPRIQRSYTVKGHLQYSLVMPSKVSLQVKDGEGKIVKKFLDEESKQKGNHTCDYAFSWKEGKYETQLVVNGQIRAKKTFEIASSQN